MFSPRYRPFPRYAAASLVTPACGMLTTCGGAFEHRPLVQHLRHVFEELSVDGSKEILFVRACAPTADKRPDADDGQGFELATQFVHWHPPELQASGVDPSLTRMALCAAADGLPPPLLDQPGCAQYGGLEGGLRSLVKLFAPEVHTQSPYTSFPIPTL
jgi:hypothetical protein